MLFQLASAIIPLMIKHSFVRGRNGARSESEREGKEEKKELHIFETANGVNVVSSSNMHAFIILTKYSCLLLPSSLSFVSEIPCDNQSFG
jgi:hypothetical protein